MVLAGNKAKCLSLVNHTTKTIHHHHHHHHHHAPVTLTSVITFGGKKMQSCREEYFSSKYFKENVDEM